MRVHFSSVAAVFVALLFVAGTVGCRSNGGDWYNPNTYSWANPFSKDGQTPPRSSESFTNTRPSLDAQPNISVPHGGYSEESSLASHSNVITGGTGNVSQEPWGQHQVASQTPPSHLGGYTVAEPSHLPAYMMEGHMSNHQSIASVPQQHMPHQNQFGHQAPQEMMGQHQHSMPYGHSDYVPTGFHQPINTGIHQQQPVQHHAPLGVQVGVEHQHLGGHAPFGAIQQPVTVPPAGFGFEQQPAQSQQMQAPQPGFPNEGFPVGSPHQPHHQPPPTGGFNHW